ncbi:tyrosine-type recombinase/integrase [Thiomonas sp. FB-Cd]|uniref:tyrosine-type recombinase/integrase n=1 Tax=Thiomonas sp. FB-Cd TaxID=1158292 RepID=UPI00068E33E9|nr:tyrosine-type recombinase/integrase [Thiomonas sp. FB-Cd]
MRAVPVHPRIRRCLPYLLITINRSTLQKDIVRAKECAQISGVRFHDLRQSAASEMVNAGVDLFTLGTVLGHRARAAPSAIAT